MARLAIGSILGVAAPHDGQIAAQGDFSDCVDMSERPKNVLALWIDCPYCSGGHAVYRAYLVGPQFERWEREAPADLPCRQCGRSLGQVRRYPREQAYGWHPELEEQDKKGK